MHFFVNMKKRYKILIAALIVIVFVIIIYLFMTPDGAMRRAVFMHGYPKKAVVMAYGGTTQSKEELKDNETLYVISDPPYDGETDTYEENWIVTKTFLFYSAKCIDK